MEEFKDFVLFFIAVISGLGIRDGIARYWAHERAILIYADLQVFCDNGSDGAKALEIDEQWLDVRGKKLWCILKIECMNNSLERIVIVRTEVLYSENKKESICESHGKPLRTTIEPRAEPVTWSHRSTLHDISRLQGIKLFEPYGKVRKLHNKRVREIRAEAESYLRRWENSNTQEGK